MGDSSRLSGDVFERLGTRTSVWLGDLGVHEQTNIGVIDDEFETILIDANFSWAAGRISDALAANGAKPIGHVVNTHYHVDHSDGNGVLVERGVTVVGAAGQGRELASKGPEDAIIQMKAVPDRFYPPSMEFSGTLTFPHSGLTLEAIPPAHTGSDVIAWVACDRVLFVGDLAVLWEDGNNFSDVDADIDGWLAALARCLAFHPRVVVPAHGRLGGPELLVEQRDFVQELWDWALGAVDEDEPRPDVAGLTRRHPHYTADEDDLFGMAHSMVEAARRRAARD